MILSSLVINRASKQGKAKDIDESEDKMFRLSPKMMVYGRAYFKGEVLAEITDMGFNTIQDVISALAKKLPDYIPNGCAVHFRLLNCDTQKEVVYERTKGKGF